MHELSLTKPIVDIAVDNAKQAGAQRISKIVVIVGKLSGAVPYAIEFCFQSLAIGTLAEGAELVIEEEACKGHCSQCDHDFEVDQYYYPCPQCDSFEIEREGGDRFFLKEIEIETEVQASQ